MAVLAFCCWLPGHGAGGRSELCSTFDVEIIPGETKNLRHVYSKIPETESCISGVPSPPSLRAPASISSSSHCVDFSFQRRGKRADPVHHCRNQQWAWRTREGREAGIQTPMGPDEGGAPVGMSAGARRNDTYFVPSHTSYTCSAAQSSCAYLQNRQLV